MKANKNTKPLILIISLLTIIVILLGIILFFQTPNNSEIPIAPSEQAPHPTPTAQTPIEKNEKSIAIPGYESLTLKADTKEQELSLKNPEQNTCYFVITLTLEDGTELWRSEYIEAGAVSKPIVLNQALSAGSYPALLKYECYRMDENKTPLNGAETKLTLRVK